MHVSVGVMAFNEEKNIAKLLDSLLHQSLKSVHIREIIVISSGSTDKTDSIVNRFVVKNSHIRLITQKKRIGKAAAVNLFLSLAKSEIVVIAGADLLLQKDTIENLISPFADEEVGIVGAHPVPLNDSKTFMGFAAHLLWNLHHQISSISPKMGEVIAFRKLFKRIPQLSAVDEANIEPLIRGQGYKAVYAPRAIVYNKGPETVSEFIARRRHITAGHLCVKHEYSYEVSTMNSFNILYLLLKHVRLSWRFIIWTPAVIALEAWSRFLGFLDYRFKLKNHTIWQVTPSTKQLIPAGRQNA